MCSVFVLGYYFSFLLLGGPFCYVTVVPTLTVNERVMRGFFLKATRSAQEGVISESPSGPRRQGEECFSFSDLDLFII